MSSPPTPTTSINAAPLHNAAHKPRRRYPFPFLTTFSLFRKKNFSRNARSPSPVEPYEVAPGIWSTDATAKVFGYLDLKEKEEKPRERNVGSSLRDHHHLLNRKPVTRTNSQDRGGQAHEDGKLDILDQRTTNTSAELPSQSSRELSNGARIAAKQAREAIERSKMRTVSRDDQLVQRGANPRTGLVSPFVVSNSSEDSLAQDCVNLCKAQGDGWLLPKDRARSEQWKQQGGGWRLVESPSLSPIAQSINDPLSRKVSVKQPEDKLLFEMPGVEIQAPENMTDQQIKRYQEDIAHAYRHGGTAAMLNPSTLPSPRQSTPDGPSTPPNKLQRMKRKVTWGGPGRKAEFSNNIIISEQKRVSTTSVQREDDMVPSENAFLGHGKERALDQTKNRAH